MPPQRVAVFVDGFNLYHAIKEEGQNYLKWVSLRKLSEVFAPKPSFEIVHVFYFSALATWRPEAMVRHRRYIKALKAEGVEVVLGSFKRKDRRCFSCKERWQAHEEKETDVNLALYLLDGAYQNTYDRALIISADSDLTPAIRMVRKQFPEKRIRIITPIGKPHCLELKEAVGGEREVRHIQRVHLEECLLPETIIDEDERIVRPKEYDPPH